MYTYVCTVKVMYLLNLLQRYPATVQCVAHSRQGLVNTDLSPFIPLDPSRCDSKEPSRSRTRKQRLRLITSSRSVPSHHYSPAGVISQGNMQ